MMQTYMAFELLRQGKHNAVKIRVLSSFIWNTFINILNLDRSLVHLQWIYLCSRLTSLVATLVRSWLSQSWPFQWWWTLRHAQCPCALWPLLSGRYPVKTRRWSWGQDWVTVWVESLSRRLTVCYCCRLAPCLPFGTCCKQKKNGQICIMACK